MNIKDLGTTLRELLVRRRIESGRNMIREQEDVLRSVSPGDPVAPYLFFVMSAWAEYSKPALEIAGALASAYKEESWPTLSLIAFASIHAGWAALALYRGADSEVETHCHWIFDHAHHFGGDCELLGSVNLTLARSRKKRALYDSSLELAESAETLFGQAHLPGLVAVSQATKAWLWMQLGHVEDKSLQCCEQARHFLEKDTEDWTILANIRFGEARRRCRAGGDEEGCAALQDAIDLYCKSDPPHRNLSRALTEQANVLHRMASSCSDPVLAKSLRQRAAGNIIRAEKLLGNGDDDPRNYSRLLRSMVTQHLHALHPSLQKARQAANAALEFARKHKDKLMIARALYKLALIEYRAARYFAGCERPVYALVCAGRYATDALVLADQMCNSRLSARIHTLRGNIFLEAPFCDVGAATEEWQAAVDLMKSNPDLDYVVEQIHFLGQRLDLPVWSVTKP